ncbi:MAG TPA: hypothetical protein PKA27_05230 [Fimbriimonadaceae bacterium]|nr:hypothetical protein [Fimbriimonadaceae bacterium]
MITFVFLIALLDRLVGEFGSTGTPLIIVLAGLMLSVVGLVKLLSITHLCSKVQQDLRVNRNEIAITLFASWALQLLTLILFLGGVVPPDGSLVLVAAIGSCCTPSKSLVCGREPKKLSGEDV